MYYKNNNTDNITKKYFNNFDIAKSYFDELSNF